MSSTQIATVQFALLCAKRHHSRYNGGQHGAAVIDAVERWIANPTEENRAAAHDAARAAHYAGSPSGRAISYAGFAAAYTAGWCESDYAIFRHDESFNAVDAAAGVIAREATIIPSLSDAYKEIRWQTETAAALGVSPDVGARLPEGPLA